MKTPIILFCIKMYFSDVMVVFQCGYNNDCINKTIIVVNKLQFLKYKNSKQYIKINQRLPSPFSPPLPNAPDNESDIGVSGMLRLLAK